MKKTYTALALALVCLGVRAQDALPMLLVPSDARALALGGNTLVQEPACKKVSATLSYGIWAPGDIHDNLLAADVQLRLGKSGTCTLGLDFADFLGKPYELTTSLGTVRGKYTPYDMRIGLGARMTFGPHFAASLKGRFIQSVLSPDNKGTAFGVDAGVEYMAAGLRAVLAGCNFGTPVRYTQDGTAYNSPALIKAGVAYSFLGITPAVELDYLLGGPMMVAAGIEYNLKDMAFLRVGYHYGPANKALPSFASVGAGMHIAGISLNAAYLFASKVLGNTFLVGLGYSF
ncbi:MAG: PorV/PorQ family protein [Bacteroidales bacterium]|nr:PorV/PorQ family protein [Bacteroidales bacterium]